MDIVIKCAIGPLPKIRLSQNLSYSIMDKHPLTSNIELTTVKYSPKLIGLAICVTTSQTNNVKTVEKTKITNNYFFLFSPDLYSKFKIILKIKLHMSDNQQMNWHFL